MIVYTLKKEKITLDDKPLASGGEGEVRQVVSCPSRFTNVCAKLYFKPQQTAEKEKKIRYMVENPPSTIVGKGSMLAWPLETIYSDRKDFIGFLMPNAFPDSKKLVILTTQKIKSSLKNEWTKFDKEKDKKTALISRLKLVNNIAIPIHLLHETGKYVLKDFKPDNVLVTPNGKVTVVDMDSIQICDNAKMLFAGSAATLEYIPPEFYKGVGQNEKVPLERSWDYFAISVVFYQLIFGLHPYVSTPVKETEESHTISYCIKENLFPFGSNASKIKSFPAPHNNFKIIPQSVKNLFMRAFGDEPENRPTVMEWGKTVNTIVRSGPSEDPPKKLETDSHKYCPKCGTSNVKQAKYCKACGASFEGGKTRNGGTIAAIIVIVGIILLFILFLLGL
ncbi:MAG: hypothetical protein K5882_10325 [Bacteroidales bacterium]|nr:hypothetical protein [Bacteroidales bacterium]